MSRRSSPALATCMTLLAFYAGIYLYYRFIAASSVKIVTAAHVMLDRPFDDTGLSAPQFTFNARSRAMAHSRAHSSCARQPNVIMRLCKKTNVDFARGANIVFYPLARLDHLITGKHFRFSRHLESPAMLK